jgi:hypothetical protein
MRFKNELLEVPTPDGPRMMTREAAVQHQIFQAAMKGNVQAQIFLSRKFEKLAERRAEIEWGLRKLVEKLEGENAPALTDEQSTFIEAATRYLDGEISIDEVPFVPVGDPRPDSWDKSMKPSKEQMDWIIGKLKTKNGQAEDDTK